MEFSNNELDVSALPKLEAQDFIKLHKNYLQIIFISRSFMVLALLAGLAIASFQGLPGYYWFAIGILVFAAFFLWLGYLGFHKKGYALREKDVSYRRGVLFHSITVVPLNRIQHSEVIRGPLDRYFGLSSVKIYTAGGSSSDITIPGLKLEVAENVREYITHKIKSEQDVTS